MKLQRFAQAALGFLALQGCSGSTADIQEIGVSDLGDQHVAGEFSAKVAGASRFYYATVLLKVGPNGDVTDAALTNVKFVYGASEALDAARKLKFKPQTFDGRLIQAVSEIAIRFGVPEIPPDTSVPFPSAARSDFEVTLTRGPCFGTCPEYHVWIAGDGRARISVSSRSPGQDAADPPRRFGKGNALWHGEHVASVSPQAAEALLERFRAAHFMGLQPEYASGVADSSASLLSLRVGDVQKEVVDDLGEDVGMPASVRALEEMVDAVAGTARWVNGNAGTIDLLKREGFDFKSSAAAELVQSAIEMNKHADDQSGVSGLMLAALEAGLDLDIAVSLGKQSRSRAVRPIGVVMVMYAAERAEEALFEELVRRGQLEKLRQSELDSVLQGGVGCSPGIAKVLVGAGADPNASSADGSALHWVRENLGLCSRVGSERRAEMAKTLIRLGALPDTRDDGGWTPLMECADPALAKVLLDAGADPNAKNDEGLTPLLSARDDRVALLLLRAGADPGARYEDRTIRLRAREWYWPGTLAWLNAHDVP